MNACFDRLVPVIEKYEGIVEKFIGDEVYAIFGAPVAHENDPERAVRTALEMMDELSKFNSDHDINMGMHIGINTGLVIAGGIGSQRQQQYGVMGDAVNLAKRLEGAAPDGGVLISARDLPSRARGVQSGAPGADSVSKAKPNLCRPTSYNEPSRVPSAWKPRGVEGVETRMVGRDAELLTLQNIFRDVMEDSGNAHRDRGR